MRIFVCLCFCVYCSSTIVSMPCMKFGEVSCAHIVIIHVLSCCRCLRIGRFVKVSKYEAACR